MAEEAKEEKKVEVISPDEVIIEEPLDNINGVTPEAAQAIKRMLEKGVRYFGSAGASLTHQVYGGDKEGEAFKPELAKIGLEGERDSSLFLQDWIKDKPNCVLIDSVHINMKYKDKNVDPEEEPPDDQPDEETGIVDGKDTDHVLLMGSEILLIDTKRWKKKSRYSVSKNGHVMRNEKPFSGSKVRIRNAAYIWFNYLSNRVKILGVIFINSEEVKVRRDYNWFSQKIFRVVEKDRMKEFLDKKWEQLPDKDRRTIDTTSVAQIALSAIKPYDVYEKHFNKKGIDQLLGKDKKK